MSAPVISVVITMYREGELLAETIESILRQTCQDFEIVLVNNNADPLTVTVANRYREKYPEKIRIVHEPIQGVSAAKNRGIIESRGTYIALHDGDDLSHPERLHLQFQAMKENPSLAFVGSWFDRVGPDGKEIIKQDVSGAAPYFWLRTEQIIKKLYPERPLSDPSSPLNFALISTTFFKRETAIHVGLFDTRFNPRWFEDFEFLTRLYDTGEVLKIPRSLLRYRMHTPERATILRKQMNWLAVIRHLDLFYNILWDRYQSRTPDAPEIFRELRAFWLTYVSGFFLEHKKGRILGKMALGRALKENRQDPYIWKLWGKSLLPQSLYPKLFWFDELNPSPLPEGANEHLVKGLFSPYSSSINKGD
ncbi:MAG: glycosyltransferase family 2 protein [Nitrospirae bacterium]|nr:glycosyltransferase family 2 protein [Nitrospirota bacterium]